MSRREADIVDTLPDAIETLRLKALEAAAPDDESAQEVADCLTIAWAAAERWRIEQYGQVADTTA